MLKVALNKSMRTSDDEQGINKLWPNTGQGGAFAHEELNKRIMALLPPLMPTEETWTRICRNLKGLEELHHSIFKISPSQKNSLISQTR